MKAGYDHPHLYPVETFRLGFLRKAQKEPEVLASVGQSMKLRSGASARATGLAFLDLPLHVRGIGLGIDLVDHRVMMKRLKNRASPIRTWLGGGSVGAPGRFARKKHDYDPRKGGHHDQMEATGPGGRRNRISRVSAAPPSAPMLTDTEGYQAVACPPLRTGSKAAVKKTVRAAARVKRFISYTPALSLGPGARDEPGLLFHEFGKCRERRTRAERGRSLVSSPSSSVPSVRISWRQSQKIGLFPHRHETWALSCPTGARFDNPYIPSRAHAGISFRQPSGAA